MLVFLPLLHKSLMASKSAVWFSIVGTGLLPNAEKSMASLPPPLPHSSYSLSAAGSSDWVYQQFPSLGKSLSLCVCVRLVHHFFFKANEFKPPPLPFPPLSPAPLTPPPSPLWGQGSSPSNPGLPRASRASPLFHSHVDLSPLPRPAPLHLNIAAARSGIQRAADHLPSTQWICDPHTLHKEDIDHVSVVCVYVY